MEKLKRYFVNLFLAFDQGANAVIGGDPDMTISGRMGRAVGDGRCMACRPICWLLHLIDTDHCAKAAKNEGDEGTREVWKL